MNSKEKLLERIQKVFIDYEYELVLTRVDYFDLDNWGNKEVPSFDFKFKPKTKKFKQFWLDYTPRKTKVLHPLWMNNAVIDYVKKCRIWTPQWIACMKTKNCNKNTIGK